MGIYEELKARGLIAQVTDEEKIREEINNGKATFYIGFDATADSLHVGHFMALNLMRRLQMAGTIPITTTCDILCLMSSSISNICCTISYASKFLTFLSLPLSQKAQPILHPT